MDIKAAVIEKKSGQFKPAILELDAPMADEVLVRIAGAGICHTDLVCCDQYFPTSLECIFGHERSSSSNSIPSMISTKLSRTPGRARC